MKVYAFNKPLMNAAQAFGVDLVCEEDLDEVLGFTEMAHACVIGDAIVEHLKLNQMGFTSAMDKGQDEPRDYVAELFEAGFIDSNKQITPYVNVIATKTNAIIFYIGDDDQVSPVGERVLNALGKILRVEELMQTPVWSQYCKYVRC
ncbi:hypothetical protein SM033_00253 [Vibrio phage vB_VpaM_sm033]|nr:hypothetical protein SM033_00253 [Vibrio phage vB_VpaM_sm033]